MKTSIISEKAKISENVKIGHFCIIEDDVEIEEGTSIGNYTILHKGVKIGMNALVLMQNNQDETKLGSALRRNTFYYRDAGSR